MWELTRRLQLAWMPRLLMMVTAVVVAMDMTVI
jgi:hypothetical protein